MSPVVQTDLTEAPLLFRGKVRDIYDLGDTLLLVATDRISAFDSILPTPIPEKGVVLGFWMGKDSKDHPLGSRGSTGGPGFAESGARNWTHSAATVLAFLQKERGLLRPGHRFQPILRDNALPSLEAREPSSPAEPIVPVAMARSIVPTPAVAPALATPGR